MQLWLRVLGKRVYIEAWQLAIIKEKLGIVEFRQESCMNSVNSYTLGHSDRRKEHNQIGECQLRQRQRALLF